MMWFLVVTAVVTLYAGGAHGASAQTHAPVVCEWADSLVGSDLSTSGQRSFIGNVRFRQADVTVTCDRAVQVEGSNVVDLFGNVVVRQGTVTLRSAEARYDGNVRLATASGGVRLTDRHHTLTARAGTYSTALRTATFTGGVVASNDTITIWSDRAWYDRGSGQRVAVGRTYAVDSLHSVVMTADSLFEDPAGDSVVISSGPTGRASVWLQDSAVLSIAADTIAVFQRPMGDSVHAVGSIAIHHPSFAARAEVLHHQETRGWSRLLGSPVLWVDSAQLTADTLTIEAPGQKLHHIVGSGMGLLASVSDTLYRTRIDQVVGDVVTITVANDSVRSIEAHPNARSITWRWEGTDPQGVATFASDSLVAVMSQGTIDEVLWLDGVAGEVVPERLAVGKEHSFNVAHFVWHTDRPVAVPVPPAPIRKPEDRRTDDRR